VIDTVIQSDFLSTTLATLQEAAGTPADAPMAPWWTGLIIYLPAVSALLCGLCAAMRIRSKLPALITAALLGLSFVLTLLLYLGYEDGHPLTAHLFDWFNIQWDGGSFIANFSLYIDSLTLLWMLFVTGLGTLIAIYAGEYMEADTKTAGYARFFAGVSIFLFAMSCLVMANNLVLLYLGWEGVGFASYFLIGYYYQKPSAVAAAKKAFIMNRIGDLGLALAIWFIWHNFGTVEYDMLFAAIESDLYATEKGGWTVHTIPYLLMLGAFGKSAQLPLYVWLPDAMEGPTPVSALIHAATMVTAGVYLLCRMFPVMELAPYALPTVAWVGTLTALLAATIGMAQFDFKRIWAYSTVSQLGYMFAGVGVMTTYGAAYHVFTHAFFKAVLFLTAGAVMHGFAGQLDLRKISGLGRMKGWGIVTWTMLIGCLCLAGFPLTSGFFSKDAIIAETFVHHHPMIGWLLLLTAGLTAYYTFRVWFRVCMGEKRYEMGDEHHGDDDDHANGGHHGHHHHEPHAPRLAINAVLVVICIGAILAVIPKFVPDDDGIVAGGWVAEMVYDSSARDGVATHGTLELTNSVNPTHSDAHDGHGTFLGMNPHGGIMYVVSAIVGLIGIAVAIWLHWLRRQAADDLKARLLSNRAIAWLPRAMENKWYVDEVYDAVVRKPLWVFGLLFGLFDKLIIDVLIIDVLFGKTPRWLGRTFQPLQSGVLHDYAKTMAGAAALILLFVMLLVSGALNFLIGGGGDVIVP